MQTSFPDTPSKTMASGSRALVRTIGGFACAFLYGLIAAAEDRGAADPEIAATQALLREERLFRGKCNGVWDTQTEAAVRRFQMIHGLRVTGRLDSPTSETMGLPQFTPPAVREADQKFLQEQFAARPGPLKTQPGTRPAKVSPAALNTPPAGAGTEQVRQVLQRFVEAAAQPDAADELGCFTGSVDYFDRGTVDRNALSESLRRARSQWPERRFELLDVEPVFAAGQGAVGVRFTLRFQNSNGRQRSAGIEKQEATLVPEHGEWKLAAIHKVGAPTGKLAMHGVP